MVAVRVGDRLLIVEGSFGMKQSALLLTESYHPPYQSTCCAKDRRRDGYQIRMRLAGVRPATTFLAQDRVGRRE